MIGTTGTTLDRTLRKRLETAIRNARVVAEEGAADALRRLGVIEDAAPTYLSDSEKELRVRLRAHARTLGDGWDKDKKRLFGSKRLQEAVAYEAWHRMLFGRFLVERELLVHPEIGIAIGRDELAELAQEEGLPDQWALVERLAAPALPAVFRPDDPVLAVALAPEFAKRLRGFVAALPEEVFAAEDSLGWTYQFWRATEKDAINKAGSKIGAAELPAVTQLFTEPYMVKFLLHNTLGAWWADKVLTANPHLARDALNEQALRDACALPSVGWEFLRFVRDDDTGPWRPAAGSFLGWPERAAEITFLDPCCGSGHFLVEAFALLAALRRAEEGLSAEDAARAVLRDNLHGLEIDGRCVQIAAFNVALSAWRLAGGPVALPQPHIAWVGAQPPSRAEMTALASGDPALRRALEALHDQFAQAPFLGSLLEVGAYDLLDVDLRERGEMALTRLRGAEPEWVEGAVAARGLLDAAELLGRRYVLQATNVPFLGRGRQDPALASHIARCFEAAKADLATAMLERMRSMMTPCGAMASVTPQNWLFLGSYKVLREELLSSVSLAILAVLGEHGFSSNAAAGAFTALTVMRNTLPKAETMFLGLDATTVHDPAEKATLLRKGEVRIVEQLEQKRNPDMRISINHTATGNLLSEYAYAYQGLSTGDNPRFRRFHWEVLHLKPRWMPEQTTVDETCDYGGRSGIILWDGGKGELYQFGRENVATLHNVDRRGEDAWGKSGVAVSQMRNLPVTLFNGQQFDTNVSSIIPNNAAHIKAVWAFCSSQEYNEGNCSPGVVLGR